jgi:TRAP-type C4-dicarboxylate transport system permease small subunit
LSQAPANDAAGINPAPAPDSLLARLDAALGLLNRALQLPCMLALLIAAGILTYSVVVRYVLKVPTDWQDEAAVFLLVGATFLTGAHVQQVRGHIGIEAIGGLLPPAVNRLRYLFVDLATAFFCLFFAWKSWTLFHEAWADNQTTTSSWGPPLWIPYATMAAGMTLVGLQSVLQGLVRMAAWRRPS